MLMLTVLMMLMAVVLDSDGDDYENYDGDCDEDYGVDGDDDVGGDGAYDVDDADE